MRSPLQGITSLPQLLSLPYFDFMACLGAVSLHPGGELATQQAIEASLLRIGENVLEIGCGTGWTTKALISAGVRVTVVDNSSRMLDATLRNCVLAGLPLPASILGTAEDLRTLNDKQFDLALMECVLGFIPNRSRALKEARRVLREAGRIAVIDVHYTAEPPESTLENLSNVLGMRLPVLTEQDWKEMFSDFRLRHWKSSDLASPPPPTPQIVQAILLNSGLLHQLPDHSDSAIEAIAERWCYWEDAFAANRKFLKSHVAVWDQA